MELPPARCGHIEEAWALHGLFLDLSYMFPQFEKLPWTSQLEVGDGDVHVLSRGPDLGLWDEFTTKFGKRACNRQNAMQILEGSEWWPKIQCLQFD